MTDEKIPSLPTDRAKRRQELAQTTYQAGNLFVPADATQLMDMANMLSQSGTMLSPLYRGQVADCAALIAMCVPYGFNPIQVSWKTYKASKDGDAPIAYEAQLVAAMVNVGAPIKDRLDYSHDGEGQDRTCTVTATHARSGKVLPYTTPELHKISKRSPLWKDDPDQQLGYYAARAWARRHFPEMLMGVYTPDEMPVEHGYQNARDITPSADRHPTMQERLDAQQAAQQEQAGLEDQAPDVEPEDVSQDAEDAEVIPDAVSVEWQKGCDAYHEGAELSDNPYTDGPEAEQWDEGWNKAYGENEKPKADG